MTGHKFALPALLVAAMSAPAGCGDDSKESTTKRPAPAAEPSTALTELEAARDGLASAISTYQSGDRAAAERQAGDAYLEHFEHVEPDLEKADEELNEEIEEQLAHELRDKMKADAPVREVKAFGRQIKRNLDRAEAALK
jgi:hypothetical protein